MPKDETYLTKWKWRILAKVARGKISGTQAIKELAEEVDGNVSRGTFYAYAKAMCDDGLMTSKSREDDNFLTYTEYQITAEGRRVLNKTRTSLLGEIALINAGLGALI